MEYTTILEEIDISRRFINNTITNLKNELYQYLYKNKSIKKQNCNQEGKYFKKWSKMTDDEKKDRYTSFAEYFVNKYLINGNIIEIEQMNDMTLLLTNLLIDNMKNISYKHLKWNIKKGIIESINILKYDSEINKFYLVEEKKNKHEQSDEKKLHNLKPKKVSSTRTIFNKETEKIINEELFMFILDAKKNKKLDIKLLKEEFIEILKNKLLLKRITLNDKIHIFKIFDDIYTIIINN